MSSAVVAMPESAAPHSMVKEAQQVQARKRGLVDAKSNTDGTQLAAALPAAVDIPENAKEWVAVYGVTPVRNLFGKEWKDREVGLSAVLNAVKSGKYPNVAEDQTIWRVTTTILEVGLREKVVPLYFLSLDILAKLTAAYGKKLPAQTVHEEMDELIPVLVHRIGDRNQRIHDASVQAILSLMNHLPGNGIARMHPYILADPKGVQVKEGSQEHNFYLQRRLELLQAVHASMRTMNGFDLMATLKFCKRGLDCPDDKVRSAAMSAIAELNKVNTITHSADLDINRLIGPLKPQLMEMLQKRMSDDYKEPERPRTSTSAGGTTSRPKTGEKSPKSTSRPGTSLSATQKLDWLVDNLNQFDSLTMDEYYDSDPDDRPGTGIKLTNNGPATPPKSTKAPAKPSSAKPPAPKSATKPAAKPAAAPQMKRMESVHKTNIDDIDEQLMNYILDEEAKDAVVKVAKQPLQRMKSIHAQ